MPASHDQFYHGTRHPTLDAGDTLLPHDKLPGNTPNYADFRKHSAGKVFMATGEQAAWSWSTSGDLHENGRSAVLKVNPGDGLREGPAENTANTAKVTERHDIMPGRQGTLPINWNQFSKHARHLGDAVNHPSDKEIEHGHTPSGLSLETLPDVPLPKRDGTTQGRLF